MGHFRRELRLYASAGRNSGGTGAVITVGRDPTCDAIVPRKARCRGNGARWVSRRRTRWVLRRRFPVLTVAAAGIALVAAYGQYTVPAMVPALQRPPGALARGQWWRLVTLLLVQMR
jgi:hypothetical protein